MVIITYTAHSPSDFLRG